ncbi:MAG: GTPase [Deltaproteobacteria bacterium]|nr:GTPase [Deltaproteobacteria bacterium]
MTRERVVILGAAGRDFHNFNVVFRGDARVEVVAFTATQIPKIEGRVYPAELAGPLYPVGIPILPEDQLEDIVRERDVQRVVLAYSDLSHETVMHLASRALAVGADFSMLGARTMLPSKVPVIAVCAVRTGCGKSQTSRAVVEQLGEAGKKAVIVRHPMPYGDLRKQRLQRFASYEDLAAHACTIEEREEYEGHLSRGTIVYAGVDYEAILRSAEAEADVVVWDGGNNDMPFYRPDLWVTVADAVRPGHELSFHPGEANFRAADVIVINKANSADPAHVESIKASARATNPDATVVIAASEVVAEKPELVSGKRVVLVEDGPTLTHGGMPYGAGKVAAEKYGALEVVDPRPFAVGSIRDTFAKYPHMRLLVPAMGYWDDQIKDLEATLRAIPCDTVMVATPIDLGALIKVDKPMVRVRYELADMGAPTLRDVLAGFLARGR